MSNQTTSGIAAVFNDRWFLLAAGTIVFACIFLLALTGTTDAFMDTLDRVWKFAAGAAGAVVALKARGMVQAKRAGE